MTSAHARGMPRVPSLVMLRSGAFVFSALASVACGSEDLQPERARGPATSTAPPPPATSTAPSSPVLPRAPEPELVSVIVAQGLMGRTTISCDEGQTWIVDRSFDQEGNDIICGDTTPVLSEVSSCSKMSATGGCDVQDQCDCMHDSGFGKGVAIENGIILANFGWGRPMVLMRSTDGVTWQNFQKFSYTYTDIVYGANRYVMFADTPRLSDDGMAWRDGASALFNLPGEAWRSPRASSFLDFMGGRFIGAIDGNGIRVSSDRGDSWSIATVPDGCTDGIGNRSILTGNGLAVIVTSSGKSCRSADGGYTWTLHDMPASLGGML